MQFIPQLKSWGFLTWIHVKNRKIKFDIGNLDIKSERAETPWERYSSIKSSELLRLKKWVE